MQTHLDIDQLGSVMGVWAHPDDEVFLSAGLMGRIVDRGGHVSCVTATRGERGTSDPTSWPLDRLGRRRALELRASLAALGVSDHRFLDYVDGSLPGIADRDGIERVATVLEQVRPDTVVTFGPEGMTGHGDHIAVSRWTTLAVGEVDPRIRILYATTTVEFCRRWASVNRQLGAFGEGLPLATPAEDVALELRLDGDELDRKLVALAAQASQIASLIAQLGEARFRAWWATETFRTGVPSSIRTASRADGRASRAPSSVLSR